MTELTVSDPLPRAIKDAARSHLSAKVIGACLRSAFIEALYDDCSELLAISQPEPAAPVLKVAAE